MSKSYEFVPEAPTLQGKHTYASITSLIGDIPERKTPQGWYLAFGIANIILLVLVAVLSYLVWEGIGVWGLNNPTGWGWAIIDFVWWVGIAHAGTLISAILYLFRQQWRTAINRLAEAMTIFSVMCAGLFPAFHVGRIWVIYWVFPIPNQMGMWPNFSSPLLWDVFAVTTYLIVSLIFWYIGLIPDLALLRDRVKNKTSQLLYGVFALGWTGSNRQWKNYEKAYMILAGLATALVVSVSSVVSFDMSVSNVPGWHSTIFPPYFVAGAVYSGFATVVLLMIIARKIYGLEKIMTIDIMEKLNLIMMLCGDMVAFSYLMEGFFAWYGGYIYERGIFWLYIVGPYAWGFWIVMFCNVLNQQTMWFKKLRRSTTISFIVALLADIGMWYERFMIISASLSTDFMPSSWAYYSPTWVDFLTFVGSFGVFFTFFLLFLRFLPIVAISEVKAGLPEADPHYYEEEEYLEGSGGAGSIVQPNETA